jgi:hypothetical protein
MKMNLTVKYDDGATADVVVSAVDFVAFEQEFNRSVARFESEFKFTDGCWLGWHSLSRRDKSIGEFMVWMEKVDEVNFGEAEEIVPLESTAPPSPSAT